MGFFALPFPLNASPVWRNLGSNFVFSALENNENPSFPFLTVFGLFQSCAPPIRKGTAGSFVN